MSLFPTQLEKVLKALSKKGLINDSQPSVDIFDIDYFQERMENLQTAFPEPFCMHSLAIKCNTIRGVLMQAKEQGMGAECASITEVIHSIDLGFDPNKIIFNGPVKTKLDLKQAMDFNVHINLDNEMEMKVVDELLTHECKSTKSKIGLRVNPVVGVGEVDMFSTATKSSKFGIPIIDETKDKVALLYKKYNWLTGVHIHVGSQGMPLNMIVKGAKICMDFVKQLESMCSRSVETINIGGGLASSFT